MFRDAVELFQFIGQTPVLPILARRVPQKEARFLSMEQASRLLKYVVGRDYDIAIWLQLYLGLRVSDVIALKWEDVDVDQGTALISQSYSRKDTWENKEKTFRDRLKGGKQHRVLLPPELWEFLKSRKVGATSPFVAVSPTGEMLSYEFYLETLKGYCQELGIPTVGTHGLRHSASELYLNHGATEDDIRRLFAHSSADITERYLHSRGRNLADVAKGMRLLDPRSSTNRPQLAKIA